MKKISIILGIFVLVLATGYFIFSEKPTVKNTPPKNDRIVIFGDSLAQGIGSTEGNDLASLLGKKTGKTMLNYGVSGDTTRDAAERIFSALGDDPGTAIIILGGNDVLKKIPQEETFQNLEKIINLFQDNGAAVVLVGVRSGLLGDGRGDDYEALAKKTQSAYVSDILQDVFGKKQYMSDAVHPNNTGYVQIEKRLSPVVKKIFEKDGANSTQSN